LRRAVLGATIGREAVHRDGLEDVRGKEAVCMADEGYCMKCREKRQFEGQMVTLKNGRPAAQGTCPVCGTKLTKIMGADAAKARGWSPS
jgi:hypothetical protein